MLSEDPEPDYESYRKRRDVEGRGVRKMNGGLHVDGTTEKERRAKEAEEYELDALISESEEEEQDAKAGQRSRSTGLNHNHRHVEEGASAGKEGRVRL